MFHYENFKKAMQRYSEELVQEVVYASWYGNTWFLLLIFIISFDFLRLFLIHYLTIYGILYIFFLFCFVFYINTRKVGVAISEKKITYVQFKLFGFKDKKVYEIPFCKIRMISVGKFMHFRKVKLSFISSIGKLETIRFLFSTYVIGKDAKSFKENGDGIYKKLEDMQRVLDKGDF